MTRVLFCVLPEKGHINPYIGPAQALQARGGEVAFWASADISSQLRAAGIATFLGPATPPSHALRGAEFAERVRDAGWLRTCIESMLLGSVDADPSTLRGVIRTYAPDVVAIDPMLYAAAIASELEGVPWAALSNSLNPVLPDELDSELLRTVRSLAPARAQLFARHGMTPAFRGCDVLSPHLTIAFTTHELVGRVLGVELVGPSLPRANRGDETAFPWQMLDPGRPLIYASFGSQIYHQPELFRRVIDAVDARAVQLVISAADLATSGELGTLPPNVIARPYVPQLALLKRTSVMLSHGGANSVMEAIANGVPLVIAPLCNDQFHQVHFIERAGIGRILPDGDVWTALAALVERTAPERARLAPITASYQRDGAAEAARLVSELAARTRPAPAS